LVDKVGLRDSEGFDEGLVLAEGFAEGLKATTLTVTV
jgi:hypothetical protein